MMAGRIYSFYGARPNLKEFAPEGIEGETSNGFITTPRTRPSPPSMGRAHEARANLSDHLRFRLPLFRFVGQVADLQKLGLTAGDSGCHWP